MCALNHHANSPRLPQGIRDSGHSLIHLCYNPIVADASDDRCKYRR